MSEADAMLIAIKIMAERLCEDQKTKKTVVK